MNPELKDQLREFYSALLEVEAGVIAMLGLGTDEREETVAAMNATQDRLAELQRRFSSIRLVELGVLASNSRSPGFAEGPEASQPSGGKPNRPQATPA